MKKIYKKFDIQQLDKSIDIINLSISSHKSWISYYERNPQQEKMFGETCGDIKWHKDCIAGYDFVIKALNECKNRYNEG